MYLLNRFINTMARKELKVGIVGAGIGGVMASIAIARAGGKVVVLEAAQQLGEIGAGIQMVGQIMTDVERITLTQCRRQMSLDC